MEDPKWGAMNDDAKWAQLVDRMRHHPREECPCQHVTTMPNSSTVRVLDPLSALALREMIVHQIVNAVETEQLYYEHETNQKRTLRTEAGREIARLVQLAEIFVWDSYTARLALSIDIPAAVFEQQETLFVPRTQLWIFTCPQTQEALSVTLVHGLDEGWVALNLAQQDDGVLLEGGLSTKNRDEQRHIVALLLFLRSKIPGSQTSLGLSRQLRRQFSRRSGQPEDRRQVSFVRLRVVEETHHPHNPTSSPTEPVHWSCRWLVRPHLRAQWYPSASEHRVILVPLHVKGPPEKPLRQHIFKVDR